MSDMKFEAPVSLSQESRAFISNMSSVLSGYDYERFINMLNDLDFCSYNQGARDIVAAHKAVDEMEKAAKEG